MARELQKLAISAAALSPMLMPRVLAAEARLSLA
jgi:hypothetical protein